jgi:hypothetical protein
MAEPKSRGIAIGGTPELGRVHSALQGSLGDANMQERGLGHGKYADGQNVGSRDSVYAFVNLSAAGLLTVPHGLGRVPGWAKLFEVVEGSDPAATIDVRSTDKPTWTRTTFRVRVQAITGSLAGMRLVFEVGG